MRLFGVNVLFRAVSTPHQARQVLRLRSYGMKGGVPFRYVPQAQISIRRKVRHADPGAVAARLLRAIYSQMPMDKHALFPRRMTGIHFLFADVDAQGFHLAVEVGAFEAEGFGGAGDVAAAAV